MRAAPLRMRSVACVPWCPRGSETCPAALILPRFKGRRHHKRVSGAKGRPTFKGAKVWAKHNGEKLPMANGAVCVNTGDPIVPSRSPCGGAAHAGEDAFVVTWPLVLRA